MIKKLFILQSIFFYIAANSQVITYVGNGALVTVQPQTLVYNGGSFQTAGASVVNNSGNVMVSGIATDQIALASTASFNLKFANTGSYGQLFITGIPQGKISGVVNKEYSADFQNGTTGSQQMGLPFFNFTVSDMDRTFGAGNLNLSNTANNSSGRFAPNSAFWWNNARARFDQIATNGTAYSAGVPNSAFISPMTYYIFPRRKADGSYFWNPLSDVKIFSGVPASDVIETGINNIQFSLANGYSGSFGTNGNASNFFGEKYYSYLDDPFRTKGTSWPADYGKNLYQMANPFLTNVDLKYIGTNTETGTDGNFISNLEGIAYYGDSNVSWNSQNGTVYNTSTIVAKASGGIFQSGDVDANRLMIKPLGAFMVKLDPTGSAQILNFNRTRRFKQTSRGNTTDYSVTAAKMSEDVGVPADKIVKQVAVVMYDNDGLELDRTYYAVSPTAITGFDPTATLLQAYNSSESKKIYTKEENPNGGLDYNYTDKLYINEANETDFKSKEIPLFINYPDSYQLKFEVYEKGERVENGLSNGNSFYITNDQNQLVKIVDGESIPMSGSKTLSLYYEKPSNATLGADTFGKAGTIIAKKNDQWVVRFAKDWKSAKVEVYSVSGQLLNSKSNVSTTTDYILPISDQVKNTFVVKAVSENGDVVIKKIVN